MATQIRLLYCAGDLKVGGTQRQLLNLVRGLDRRRFAVTIACLDDRGELAPAFRETGATLETYPLDRALWRPRSLGSILALARRIRGGFDLVHTLLGHANVVGLLACLLAGQRRVLASRRSLHPALGRNGRWSLAALDRWLIHRVPRRVVVNNAAIRRHLLSQGLGDDRVVLVPNGIDTDCFRPSSESGAARRAAGICPTTPVIGFVGRMITEKGLARLLQSAGPLLQEFPDLRILAVGDGPDRSDFEEIARGGPLRGRIEFLGSRLDVQHIFPLFDVFAFPSTYPEGTPNAILEAMSCAVPPVVHRTQQTEEVVLDGRTGLLRDCLSPGALAGGIAQLLRDRQRARAIGNEGRLYVREHHSLERVVATIQELYQKEVTR